MCIDFVLMRHARPVLPQITDFNGYSGGLGDLRVMAQAVRVQAGFLTVPT